MSLASRLVNNLFPGQANTFAAADENGQEALYNEGPRKSKFEKSSTVAEEETEERPPYLHVSYAQQMLRIFLTETGDAGRRPGRDVRRYADALVGYR